MSSSTQPHEGLITQAAEWMIDKIYWLSPYRWIDDYLRRREAKLRRDSAAWQRIRYRRYCASEAYIVGGLGLAFVTAIFANYLPAWIVLFCFLRALGILAKELGVILFGTCKITEGRAISTPPRVVLLALINYATITCLFAVVYQKAGTPPLPLNMAFVQAVSVSTSFGPALTPAGDAQWFSMLAQAAVAFLFLVLIISQFVSLIKLETVADLLAMKTPEQPSPDVALPAALPAAAEPA